MSDAPHPAPKRSTAGPQETFFVLFGGPLAWFIQLTAGFALASQPCFIDGTRALSSPHDWTRSAMLILIGATCAIALLAMLISWRAYQGTEDESAAVQRQVTDVATGRTRFLALWGVYLSAGSALVTIMTAIAFVVLPRCAG
jgi:hypothetical protein